MDQLKFSLLLGFFTIHLTISDKGLAGLFYQKIIKQQNPQKRVLL
jgi:hypothetical protein